ncbi:putative Protein kinase domain containing protein [Blattamonas nauphoetae]|uniref:Protein kinase domain-containing protein n=1 Tax=Blattamonas nauphoetae TaxID=2049346 RepID=A0ABQ9X662_9EUKA|nr:putative Protein kinase domain containing protein [Blattamonas nauphoetae]
MSFPYPVVEGYEIVSCITESADRPVIKIRSKKSGNHYAAKYFPTENAENKKLCENEVACLKTYAHPNIIGFHSLEEVENAQVILTELGEQSLQTYLDDALQYNRQIELENIYRICTDVVAALNVMHSHEKTPAAHGNISLRSIVLDKSHHAKLTHLRGTAKDKLKETTDEIAEANYSYTAPESLENHVSLCSPPADIWSVGIILFNLMFRRQLFPTTEGLPKLVNSLGAFKPTNVPAWPDEAQRDVLKKLLDPNPKARPTASYLVDTDAFQSFIRDPVVQARHYKRLFEESTKKSSSSSDLSYLMPLLNILGLGDDRPKMHVLAAHCDCFNGGFRLERNKLTLTRSGRAEVLRGRSTFLMDVPMPNGIVRQKFIVKELADPDNLHINIECHNMTFSNLVLFKTGRYKRLPTEYSIIFSLCSDSNCHLYMETERSLSCIKTAGMPTIKKESIIQFFMASNDTHMIWRILVDDEEIRYTFNGKRRPVYFSIGMKGEGTSLVMSTLDEKSELPKDNSPRTIDLDSIIDAAILDAAKTETDE